MGVEYPQRGRTQHDLAWSGWRQPDIAVEMDTARPKTSRFKKCCENCVLLYYPDTEFKSVFNVQYTDTVKELPGYPVQNCPSWSFFF